MRRRCYNCKTEMYNEAYTLWEKGIRISCLECVDMRSTLMEFMKEPEDIEPPLKPQYWIFPEEEGLEN